MLIVPGQHVVVQREQRNPSPRLFYFPSVINVDDATNSLAIGIDWWPGYPERRLIRHSVKKIFGVGPVQRDVEMKRPDQHWQIVDRQFDDVGTRLEIEFEIAICRRDRRNNTVNRGGQRGNQPRLFDGLVVA